MQLQIIVSNNNNNKNLGEEPRDQILDNIILTFSTV